VLLLSLFDQADSIECLLIFLLPCNQKPAVELLPAETLSVLLVKCTLLLAFRKTYQIIKDRQAQGVRDVMSPFLPAKSFHCENILCGYLYDGDLVFVILKGIYGFKFPERFLEISSRDLTLI
jgi:hypothetical protein